MDFPSYVEAHPAIVLGLALGVGVFVFGKVSGGGPKSYFTGTVTTEADRATAGAGLVTTDALQQALAAQAEKLRQEESQRYQDFISMYYNTQNISQAAANQYTNNPYFGGTY